MEIFLEISLITGIVALVSFVMKILKQPFIVGFILTGVIVGPYVLNILHSKENIEFFSKVGITILLYIVGLGLNPKVLREVGKVSLITGIGQVLFTSLIGYFICLALGIPQLPSLYIAIALTFSSTIIILKLLTDKGDVHSLYGRISIGFLLVQDLIATLILITITAVTGTAGQSAAQTILILILKGILSGLALYIVSKYVISKFIQKIAENQEMLFLFSLAWGLLTASLFHLLGFSIEIGALLAGIALSNLPYTHEMESRLKPLRDFFILLFFILLGSQMVITSIPQLILPAILLSIFVLVGNPLIVFVLMNLLGYKRKTGFMAGLTVAQISEFSLILATLGNTVGHLPVQYLSLVTLVGLITIAGSTYLIIFSDQIYAFCEKFLKLLEFNRHPKEGHLAHAPHPEIILFGYDKSGSKFINAVQELHKPFLVVDYNPEAIQRLNTENIPAEYGDAEDKDFLNEIGVSDAKLVISTIPNIDTNLFLVSHLKKINPHLQIVVISHQISDTLQLYELGASYVIVPIYFGSRFLTHLFARHGLDRQILADERARHLLDLQSQK